METLIRDNKKWLLALLLVGAGLSFLSFLFGMIEFASYYGAISIISAIFGMLVSVALFTFAYRAVKKGDVFWAKVLFIVYFAYIFFSHLVGLFDTLMYFEVGGFVAIMYGLFSFISALMLVTVGALYILDLYRGLAYKDLIEKAIMIYLGVACIALIFAIVLIAQDLMAWSSLPVAVLDIVIGLIFYCAIREYGNGVSSKSIVGETYNVTLYDETNKDNIEDTQKVDSTANENVEKEE